MLQIYFNEFKIFLKNLHAIYLYNIIKMQFKKMKNLLYI